MYSRQGGAVINYQGIQPSKGEDMRRGNSGRRRGCPQRRRKTLYMRATAVVVNRGNEVLLVKHNGQNEWSLPGGRVVAGEDPARRAVLEVASGQ